MTRIGESDVDAGTTESVAVRGKLAGFFREPLVHFLAIGAGMFVFWHFFGDRLSSQAERILITPGHVERLAQAWTKTHLRPPTSDELAGLIEQEIDEEVLYREAVALGLDRDDLDIRRRLAIKMEFVSDDLAATANPTDEQLQTFLSQHPDKFAVESFTTFAQIYINRSKRGEKAVIEAERLLASLNDKSPADWQTLGDPLPVPSEFESASAGDVARQFGKNFPRKLSELPVGRWSGPVESGYGLHLVLVRSRTPGRTPPLDEVRESVLSEWRTEQRQELNANLRRQRREKYAVAVQWPDWGTEAGKSGAGTAKGSR
jgi:PPIC-type PPIASE domain